MSDRFEFSTAVAYWDVDRDECLTLAGVFKLLQEAAIKHADQFGLGAKAMEALGETWVLSRVATAIHRYPRYEEALRVVTWSAGIRGSRGYRDLRIYCGEELVVSASTLWVFVNLQTKMLVRVPAELAERFPVGQGQMFRPYLDKMRLKPPGPEASRITVSLRYSDFDGNRHLNNTAYLDCLQTALAGLTPSPRPKALEVQFLSEVLPAAKFVELAVAPAEDGHIFSLAEAGVVRAQGFVSF